MCFLKNFGKFFKLSAVSHQLSEKANSHQLPEKATSFQQSAIRKKVRA